jgi:hypothetical protein
VEIILPRKACETLDSSGPGNTLWKFLKKDLALESQQLKQSAKRASSDLMSRRKPAESNGSICLRASRGFDSFEFISNKVSDTPLAIYD